VLYSRLAQTLHTSTDLLDLTITAFYYTFQMMAEEYCPTISAFQTHKVANQKPVPVTVYDYYDQCECEQIYTI